MGSGVDDGKVRIEKEVTDQNFLQYRGSHGEKAMLVFGLYEAIFAGERGKEGLRNIKFIA